MVKTLTRRETFADRLAALREKAGLSQYRLSQLAGLSKQTLSWLESGAVEPAWRTVQAMAAALGVEVNDFVTGPVEPVEAPAVKRPGRPRKAV